MEHSEIHTRINQEAETIRYCFMKYCLRGLNHDNDSATKRYSDFFSTPLEDTTAANLNLNSALELLMENFSDEDPVHAYYAEDFDRAKRWFAVLLDQYDQKHEKKYNPEKKEVPADASCSAGIVPSDEILKPIYECSDI